MTVTITRQRAQEVHDLAMARAGLPYSYGGAFTRDPRVSTDCSGLVLQTAAWYMGRTDWPGNRYGSTESFRLNHRIVGELGFKRLPKGGVAELGFTPVMLVGLQHGGGGVYSHTACTLMTMDKPGGPVTVSKRGVDWESQGAGVFLYDGARAWNDPLFHDFWYLDAKLEGGVTPSRTPADVLADAVGISVGRAETLLPAVQRGLELSQCTNVNRIACWLAQIGHESGSFQYTEELDKNGRYAPYIGRTWIQITWRANYEAFSRWAHSKGLISDPQLFVDHPTRLAELQWAGVGAAWYWTVARPDINALCDRNDFDAVTYRINGGQNGAADRRTRWDRARRLGKELLALTADPVTTGDDMAQVPQDQWDRVYRELTQRLPSRSIYRTPGEGTVDTLSGMVLNLDAMTHADFIERLAKLGDPDAIERIARVAAGLGAVRDQWAKDHAAKVLADVPEQFLTTYLGAQQ